MAHTTPTPLASQVRRRAAQFARAPGLPFAELLPEDHVRHALQAEAVSFRDRLVSPLVSLWVFLSQVLDPDHSCRAAVARFLAWFAELDLRALKQTMQRDVLRCHSPERVGKEMWAHLLASHLLRGLMAQTALAVGRLPWELSFQGALQAVAAFTAVLWAAPAEELVGL